MLGQHLGYRIRIFPSDDDDHADTAVEHAVHFIIGNTTGFLQPVKQRWALPAVTLNFCRQAGLQNAWHVLGNATTGNVCQPFKRTARPGKRPIQTSHKYGLVPSQIAQRLLIE